MAWTTPRTWVTNEIVTKAIMDTHVRDNLAYLKGDAGTIAFAAGATFAAGVTLNAGNFTVSSGTMTASGLVSGGGGAFTTATNTQVTIENSGADFDTFFGMTAAEVAIWDINRSPVTGVFGDTGKSHARIAMDGSGTSSFIDFLTASAANTLATSKMRLTGAGKLGVNQTTPQGMVHAYESNGGFLVYNASGIGTSLVTVIPDAAGDVTARLSVYGVVQASSGASPGTLLSLTGIAPGGGTNIDVNAAADRLRIDVTAGGAVTLQKTVGAASPTFSVTFVMAWI